MYRNMNLISCSTHNTFPFTLQSSFPLHTSLLKHLCSQPSVALSDNRISTPISLLLTHRDMQLLTLFMLLFTLPHTIMLHSPHCTVEIHGFVLVLCKEQWCLCQPLLFLSCILSVLMYGYSCFCFIWLLSHCNTINLQNQNLSISPC